VVSASGPVVFCMGAAGVEGLGLRMGVRFAGGVCKISAVVVKARSRLIWL